MGCSDGVCSAGLESANGVRVAENIQIGLPVAYGFTPNTPAAIDLKLVFEKTENGSWLAGVPVDIGFLGRTPNGATVAIVMRNMQFGRERLKTMPRRYDYGISYQMGVATISWATYLDSWYQLDAAKRRYHMGAEFAASPQYSLRGGYMHLEDRDVYTGGIALRAPGGPVEFGYSVVYDKNGFGWMHFLQYTYIVQPVRTDWNPF